MYSTRFSIFLVHLVQIIIYLETITRKDALYALVMCIRGSIILNSATHCSAERHQFVDWTLGEGM